MTKPDTCFSHLPQLLISRSFYHLNVKLNYVILLHVLFQIYYNYYFSYVKMPFHWIAEWKTLTNCILKRQGLVVDTRLVVDDGEVAIHWPLLQLWSLWWSELVQCCSAPRGLSVRSSTFWCLYGDMKPVTSVANTIVIEDNEVPDDV